MEDRCNDNNNRSMKLTSKELHPHVAQSTVLLRDNSLWMMPCVMGGAPSMLALREGVFDETNVSVRGCRVKT